MSTPEQPATPPLTRRQLREIRNTGANPVIPPPPATTGDPSTQNPDDPGSTPADSKQTSKATSTNGKGPKGGAAAAPLPRPAQPVIVPPPPIADAAVDLGVSPLTRRQARQQERIRTASVPVITPEVVAAHAGGHGGVGPFTSVAPAATAFAPAHDTSALAEAPEREDADAVTTDGVQALLDASSPSSEQAAAPSPWARPAEAPAGADAEESAAESSAEESDGDEAAGGEEGKAVVSPLLGAGLLADGRKAGEPVKAEFPASFDQLLSRSGGTVSTPNALIVSQSPEVAPLVGPVTATGEVLITGTYSLPEGLGSTGHAKGTADGKEIDATLVDGELPSHSSPTPIAASAAVSTVKMPGEVIRPPAPEKGSRLMMSLAITAGVLALALVGVLILAFVTGVF